MAAERWKPIADIEEPVAELEMPELRALDALWRDQKRELEQSASLDRFNERLARTWAIETGVIERVYELDRGTTELLIEHGLHEELVERSSTDQDPARVVRIIRDQREVIDGLFDFIARRRELSTSYVKELHAALTRTQAVVDAVDQFGRLIQVPLLQGEWKQNKNNPTRPDGTEHEYCPPEHVASEMDRLIAFHLEHVANDVVPEVEAAFLHHRFTQIHPFQDGNGRVARALATLVLLRAGWFPFTVDRERKGEYIDALEAADVGTLRYLVRMIGGVERQSLVQALGLGEQTQREQQGIDQIIATARDKVMGPGLGVSQEELEVARAHADRLFARAEGALRDLEQKLRRELVDYAPHLEVRVDAHPAGSQRAKWHRATTYSNARRLRYYANVDTYAAWLVLRLKDRDQQLQDDIIVSMHGIGATFRGLIAITAFWEKSTQEGGRWQQVGQELLNPDDLFQVNAREDYVLTEERFDEWLQSQLTAGLAIWQRGLTGGSHD